MLPDDNSPTVPNRAVPPAGQPAPAAETPAQPPYLDSSGKAPLWQVARPQGQAGTTDTTGPRIGGFGLGFAISLAVLAVMALVLVLVLNSHNNNGLVGEVPTQPPTATVTPNAQTPTATPPPPVTTSAATSITTQFYTDISSQSFQAAYNLLGTDLQSSQNFGQFQQQWQNTQSLTVDQTSITANANADGSVTVSLNYTQVLNDNSSSVVQAKARVAYDNQGNLRITALNLTATQNTPTPQVTDTPIPTATPSDTPTATSSPTATPTATTTPGP
jgi:hypothetical protein